MKSNISKELYEEAIKYIPGGVNSPVRAFKSVKRTYPVFIKSANGSKLYDEEDKEYIDYICSWGPMILGHNYPKIVETITNNLSNGISFGLPTKLEIEFAKLINRAIPSMEMVRLTTSGTEATMSAIRVARAYTKRSKILKFNGCYHGHSDSLLVGGGSGVLTSEILDNNGIPNDVSKNTILCEFGDIDTLKKLLLKEDIACVILEPIPANMGLIIPEKSFLEEIRKICTKTSTLLIFDEVISGFRVGLSGAQGLFNITPDITTLGKIIGGGFPIGAFGGKKEIMEMIAPNGPVYHAGTLSGNRISVLSGTAILNELMENEDIIYKDLKEKTEYLVSEIEKLGKKHGVGIVLNSVCSLFTIFFTHNEKVINLGDSIESCDEKYAIYFNTMVDEGIIVPPSKYEAHFMSTALTEEDMKKTLYAIDKAFEKISRVW